ncbi:hypothetical protein [Aliidiomarina indica]|uniref:hypothetical protein n=1 Tax=Aliidiomarina indica TaxID=2749147 RepID=UPI00188F792C|nr:hypothetical protein [Aliidiomarina indica]
MLDRSELWAKFVVRSAWQRVIIIMFTLAGIVGAIDIYWRAPLAKERISQRQQLRVLEAQAQAVADRDLPAPTRADTPIPIPRLPIQFDHWQFSNDAGQVQLFGPSEHMMHWLHALQSTPWLFHRLSLIFDGQELRLSGEMHQQQLWAGSAALTIPSAWQNRYVDHTDTPPGSDEEFTQQTPCISDVEWNETVLAFTPPQNYQEARIATQSKPYLMPISSYFPILTETSTLHVSISDAGLLRLFAPDRDCIPVEFPLLPARSSPVFWLP